MFKKNCFILLLCATVLLGGCQNNSLADKEGDSSQTQVTSTDNKNKETLAAGTDELLTEQEFELMLSNPLNFKERVVEFYGQIFVEPEKDEKGVYIQVHSDPLNSSKNIIVAYPDNTLELKTSDYVYIKGSVYDKFEGENVLGGKVVMPLIVADELEIVDYTTAVSPALSTLVVNESSEQHGYSTTLNKIEFAQNETRVFLTIQNKSAKKINFYSFNSKIVQGGVEQFDPVMFDLIERQEISNEILPGITQSGLIVFPAMDPDKGEITLITEGTSEDFMLEFEPFIFTTANISN